MPVPRSRWAYTGLTAILLLVASIIAPTPTCTPRSESYPRDQMIKDLLEATGSLGREALKHEITRNGLRRFQDVVSAARACVEAEYGDAVFLPDRLPTDEVKVSVVPDPIAKTWRVYFLSEPTTFLEDPHGSLVKVDLSADLKCRRCGMIAW